MNYGSFMALKHNGRVFEFQDDHYRKSVAERISKLLQLIPEDSNILMSEHTGAFTDCEILQHYLGKLVQDDLVEIYMLENCNELWKVYGK